MGLAWTWTGNLLDLTVICMELRSPSVVYSHCTCTTLPSSYDCLIRHGGSNGLSVPHPLLLPVSPLLFRPGLNSSPVTSSSLVISPHRVLLPCPALSCSPCLQLTTPAATRPFVSSTCCRETTSPIPRRLSDFPRTSAPTELTPRGRSPETAAVFPVAQTIKDTPVSAIAPSSNLGLLVDTAGDLQNSCHGCPQRSTKSREAPVPCLTRPLRVSPAGCWCCLLVTVPDRSVERAVDLRAAVTRPHLHARASEQRNRSSRPNPTKHFSQQQVCHSSYIAQAVVDTTTDSLLRHQRHGCSTTSLRFDIPLSPRSRFDHHRPVPHNRTTT